LKALVLHAQKDLRWEEAPNPVINDDEILVKVYSTGVCGSDIPRVLGTGAHYYPIVLGHEFSGEVVEIGKNVKKISVGDNVAGAPLVPCMKCEDCQNGNYSQCKNYTFIGSRIQGSFAQYVKMPELNAVKLPEGVTHEQGAFLEPTTVALHGLFVMDFKPGLDTAITGMGTIGLLTLQCAKALGAKRTFVFDIDDKRLEVAKELGADFTFNTGDPDFKNKVKEVTGGKGFPMVLETAGVEFTEKLCLELAGNKGSIMFIGTPSKSITLSQKEFEYINRKELTVRGSWMSYSAPFPGREWELAGYFFQQGFINTEKLIDRNIPMERANEAFNDLEVPGKVKGKILLRG
jgi:L-iditol 2-dehydrogenase